MKLIAHRGNVTGPNPLRENSLEYIDDAIKLGYDVEIDVRYIECEQQLYLGHDECQYPVSMLWLQQRKDKLWIHCKNLSSLRVFSDSPVNFNYFWHQTDDFTLTSCGYIWTYPGKPHTYKSVIVMPENSFGIDYLGSLVNCGCYGICSDYVGELK